MRERADDPRGRAHGPGRQALGVDISARAIERGRDLARAQGLRNVTFERADAWVRHFPRERFDLALGRLRETLVAHMSNNGVWFDSRAWIVTACRN